MYGKQRSTKRKLLNLFPGKETCKNIIALRTKRPISSLLGDGSNHTIQDGHSPFFSRTLKKKFSYTTNYSQTSLK